MTGASERAGGRGAGRRGGGGSGGGGASEKPMRVAEALATYLKRSGLGERLEATTAMDEWAERVGARIAAVAVPLHVSNGVLFVAVESSAWLMELRLMEADIRRRLNEDRQVGRIDRVRFVMAGGEEPRQRGYRPGGNR
jgi:predicted nucleic acid-binding Zn ribbon protein